MNFTVGSANSVQVSVSSLALNVSYCSNTAFDAPMTPPFNTTAFIWFENTNITGMIVGNLTRGLIRCDTYTVMGNASLSGRNLTFDNFARDDRVYTASQGGEPIQDPMFSTFWHLFSDPVGDGTQAAVAINSLQYVEESNNQTPHYRSPSIDGFAQAMWSGAPHMAASLAIMSWANDTAYPAVMHVSVSGRTRNTTFLIAALALLGVWLVAMLGLSAVMWRKTSFGDSFNSYAAARLLADRVDMVDGGAPGGLGDNVRLLERFEPIGRSTAVM